MNERDIFIAALQKTDPAERQAYLDEACAGRPWLRAQVEGLLRLHAGAEDFLEQPARGPERPPAEPAVLPERPGTIIGPYKLLEQIGEGGFGVVYMAEQTEPVRRKVALKILKPGMDTHHVVARFEAECQALALMDHPNIAKVFDGGATPSGRPYFVMELVRGVPITNFCDQNHLTPKQRLELFIPVCQAVQHAHQKGIVHRDLKPSNILVVMHDTRPVPKVIDFGIAKALGQELTDKTLFTGFAQLIGTPLYMSPEQAGQSGLDIDTRSDIYSLGVLLYELLTGTTPFNKERFRQAAYDEICRIIREEDPPRPSTRLSELSGSRSPRESSLVSIAAQRQTEPTKLTKLLRGELDWIVMKAIEKERTRRYETANGLAQDVQRFLADEPVIACPPSAGYRLRKFFRRNKRSLGAALALLLALVVTVVSLAVLWRQEVQNSADIAAALRRETTAREQERQSLYYLGIGSAHRYLFAGHVARAEQLLDECPSEYRHWEWHYLKQLCHAHQMTLAADTMVVGLGLSPEGHQVAAAGHDGTVRVWDTQTGQELHRLTGHTDSVFAVAYSPAGPTLASGSRDGTVRLWNPTDGRALGTLSGHTGFVRCVAISRDGRFVASGGDDSTLRVWDATTRQEKFRLAGHSELVSGVSFSPDGQVLASASWDKTIKLWNVATGREIRTLRGHTNRVNCVDFSPDGKRLVTGGWDYSVRLWDPMTGQELHPLFGHTYVVHAVAFNAAGTLVASASGDRTVKVWNLATGRVLFTLRGHTEQATGVAFSQDGRRIVSGSYDQTVRFWNAIDQDARTLWGHTAEPSSDQRPTATVYQVAFSPDGKTLASAGYDRTVRVWDRATDRETMALKGHTKWGTLSVAYSPDGKWMASGGGDATVRVWDAATGREVRTLTGQKRSCRSVAFSPDSRWVASANHDGTVKLWDVLTGRELLTLAAHQKEIYGLAIGPDGKRLATASVDGFVKVWATDGGNELLTIVTGTNTYSVAFSPDGTRLVTGGGTGTAGTAKVWDAATGQAVITLKGHTGLVHGVAVSPDGERIVTVSFDQTVMLWDSRTGRELLTLRGHSGPVWGVAFSPDGQTLATSSADGTIKLWAGGTGPVAGR